MPFDQLVLKDERFGGGIGADNIEVGDLADQFACLRVEPAGRLEVRAHTIAQGDSLAHVEDLAIGVLHEVDARLRWQGGEAFAEVGARGRRATARTHVRILDAR